MASLLTAGSASAASVTATDGGTTTYGACNGIAIDFDATAAPNAVWTPGLINGQTYTLNSVAIKNGSGNTGTYYLGVYTGFSGGNLSGFKGVSDSAKDLSTSPDNWLTFTFSNLNYTLTVDSTVGSGSGLHYFVYQSGTSALTSPNVTLGTERFSADTYMTNSLASIIAFGGLVANRSPQYQATITPVSAPPPPPAAPTGLSATVSNAAVSLVWTASSGATNYNVKRSLTSGSGYTTVAGVAGTNYVDTGVAYGTYYYVVSALNAGGESTNSTEVSVTLTQLPFPVAITNSIGVSVVVGSNGVYLVNFVTPAWTFTGNLAQGLTNRTINTGTDNIGSYSEITFNYTSAVPHTAGIRLYNNSPVATFNDTTLAAGTNDLAFPRWVGYPATRSHLSFGNIFTLYNFNTLFGDNLWLFFQTNHDAFLISAATNYMVASTVMKSDGSISCGINAAITNLPSGFTHRFILVAQNGINQIYSTWGNALLTLTGKTPPANDAVPELKSLGYWTDNGSTYGYNTNAPMGIEATLLAIRDEFQSKGVPIGSVQLDSWHYPKGIAQSYSDVNSGIYLYIAHPLLFPDGLASYQQQLGLPFIRHARWIDTNSPYRGIYQMSADVCIDPAYWSNIMTEVKSSGAVTYEQDWLGFRGTPLMNLNDPVAYLNNMAWAAASNGINLQYCMVEGRDYLQGTLYTNLMTIRTSQDRFSTNRWTECLYGSRLAQAMGIWPWTDVYMSSETRNLLISTLSAGPVGVGDPLGSVNATNLLKSVRPDGVIVKPDVPLVPVDDAYVNDALNLGQPFVAATYTDHTNSRALYVFAYGENPAKLTSSFRPADLGITSNAYVYDYFAATGMVVNAGSAFNFTTTMPDPANGGSFFIAAPIGSSGVALIGDTGKFVTRGKKRISQLTDNGTLTATVKFVAGEQSVMLAGYSSAYPSIEFSQGSGEMIYYNPATGLFTVRVEPGGGGTAVVQFGSDGTAPPAPAAPTGLRAFSISSSQINLSWSGSSGAVAYFLKRATNHGGPYTTVATSFTTSYSDTGLAAGTTYYYVVSALNGAESAYSAEASASTVPFYTMAPVADSYVQDNTPGSNYGTLTNLVVKNASGTAVRNAYLMFDVHTLTNVLGATVTLTSDRVDAPAIMYYELAPTNWTETGINWTNQPGGTGVFLLTNTVFATGVAAVFDVTSAAATQATNGGLLSIRITQQANGGNTFIQYCSKECAIPGLRPILQYTRLTNAPPVLAAITNRTIGVGVTLNITNSATDSAVPLTYSLLTAPTNAAINADSGVLTWRPIITQANTTNPFTVMVADNSAPSMSATQSFVVTVSPLLPPHFSAVSWNGSQLVLQVDGDSGPDYQIQVSTNLVNWTGMFTTNSPAVPFVWTNNNTGSPVNFFRVLVGPPFP